MNEQLAAKIRAAPNLPSLPAIAIQILELTQKPDADIAEIARVISKDPALSSKILRTVNSSFYGRAKNVGTISHALVILGLQSVKTLALGFSLVSNLSAKGTGKGFNHIAYWKRSIYGATAARALSMRIKFAQQEEAFLAALLSDIGMLVLDRVVGDAYGALFDKVRSHAELMTAEHESIGATHAEVGGMLAAMWNLPPVLATPVANHHMPESVADEPLRKLTELVGVAGRCADVFVDEQAASAIAGARMLCLQRYRMPETECDALLAEIGKRTKEVASLFEINIGSVAEYEAILKKANDALVEITLKTQQQATALAQQTSTLQQQNAQLQQQASTDGLTGLANRARFDAFLAHELSAAVKSSKPLALLMIDLDRFKSVNDTHGHPAGDAVLRAVARVLYGATRKQDLAARYGGEEMALVVRNVNRATAAALAENVRRQIAAKPVQAGKAQVPVTASIGVAVFEPGSTFRTPAHLIKAADLALYNAKQSGRNCVKVFTLKPANAPPTATGAAAQTSAAADPTPAPKPAAA